MTKYSNVRCLWSCLDIANSVNRLRTDKTFHSHLRSVIAFVLCCSILTPPCFAAKSTLLPKNTDPMQTAEILGVRSQFDRLQFLRQNADGNDEELIQLRALLLRKILRGVLEVRQYCNKLDLERAYAYDIMQKEQRRQAFIGQLFTVANFAQISTFYTLEPFVRLHEQFVMSGVFTTVSGSLNTTISTLSRVHGAVAKASDVAPPKVLGNLVEGGPIDASDMPPLVAKYFDCNASGSDRTRRQELFSFWLRNYRIDASNREHLCSLSDKRKASLKLLRSRILLLWSLHTAVQQFDCDLLALLRLMGTPTPADPSSNASESDSNSSEVLNLLKIGSYLDELSNLKKTGGDVARINELELLILEKALIGGLEIQVASDKVDEDLYYNYHIILSDLLSSRAKWLQLNHDANFLQSGILGIVAGRLYLSRLSFAGDQMFVISGANGTVLTTLAMLQMHGFWRKVDTGPNSLAEIFNLHPQDDFRFSPFVSRLLNSPLPGSTDGKSRRELLNEAWKLSHATTMNMDSPKAQLAVSSMPSHKLDTIKVVKNRITLLHSLKKELESFQVEVLDLLHKTEDDRPPNLASQASQPGGTQMTEHGREAARLMGIEHEVQSLIDLKNSGRLDRFDLNAIRLQLHLVRKIMSTGLMLRVVSAKFDREITLEQQALDRVTRERDFAVAILNNANFLQLGILSTIIDGPLAQTTKKKHILYGDRLNIVSGLTVGGLALLSLCAQRGGIRHAKSDANLLGQTLGLQTPDSEHLPALLWSYLNSVPPNNVTGGLTRREQLIKYWETSKVLPVNIKKEATKERVSGHGTRHHRWCESIRLMTARVTMLFDLRAMVDRLNAGLVELLQVLD